MKKVRYNPNLYKIPEDYTINYSELSVVPLESKVLTLFFYAQRGMETNVDSIETGTGLSREQIKFGIQHLLNGGAQ